jgi:hypothetical protein
LNNAVAAGSIIPAQLPLVRFGTAARAYHFANRLKNNLLPFAEIGFVSLWVLHASDQTTKETRT